jgi:hypothetical protein
MVLVGVLAVSQCMIWWPHTPSGEPVGSGGAGVMTVTIGAGDQYGWASVSINGGQAISAEAAAEQLAQLVGSADRPLELRISGGVRQQELELLRRVLADTLGGRQLPILVTVIDDSDEAFASLDQPGQSSDVAKEGR